MADETKIIRLVIDASRAVEGSAAATRALEKLEKQQAATASTLDRMEASLGKIGGAIKAQLAIMVADLAARFVQFAKSAFDAVSGLDELAEQLGITTRGVQALQFSAAQNGVSLEKLESGVGKFSQKMGEAAEGSKEMIEALQNLGVKNLDAQGKLRPTEALMRDVAEAILKIDDPARRAAASIDFFGKAGAKMQTMLPDLAAGTDALGQKAAAAGAMIDDKTIKALDKLADSSSVAGLRWRALAVTIGEPIATGAIDVINAALGKLLGNLKDLAAQRERSEQGVLPDKDLEMLKQRADYWNAEAAKKGNRNNALIQNKAERATQALANATAGAGPAGTGQSGADRVDVVRDQYATQLLVSGTFAPTQPLDPEGAGTSTVKGAGQDVADRINKQTEALKAAAAAQNEMTAAARAGDVAFAEQEIRLKALQLALSAYGDKAKASDAEVQKLAASYERLIRQDVQGKAAQSFVTATAELEKQNVLLEAENRLLDAAPDLRARELAILKSTQEAQKAGNALTAEDIENRRKAIEANEQLKTQAEDLKKAQELWTEPLKQALRDIQTAGADAFDKLLESGNFSFDNLAQTFTKILRRMAAEFLALATIRPVLSVLVSTVASAGLISPASAASFGYGANGVPGVGMSAPAGGGSGAGLGGLGMPSTGSLGLGDFFSRPIASLFPSSAPAGGFSDVGALLQSGQTGASASASGIGGLGGIGIGQGLGALAGFGMGAYNLINSKSTGQTIGGIGSMIGAAVSLIPGIGQIAGPIISIASALLPSLIGEADTRTHNSTNASLRYGAGGYGTSGGAWGPGANVSQSQAALGSIGGNIAGVYDLLGGVKDPGKVWGMDLSSWTASGKDWSYTSRATHLVDPSGNRTAWRMNEDGMVDTASAQVAMRSILGGAVGEISANMRTAVTAMLPATTTLQDVAKGVDFVTNTYDQLGKTVVSIKPGLDALEKQFKEMATTASALGLSLDPVAAEQKKQTERLAQDFIDGMLDPLAVQLRALDDERQQSLASARYILENVENVYVDLDRITTYYARKEADTKAAAWGSAIDSIESAIRRLTTGDLSNTSPTTGLAGLRASYGATLAQARAGDAAAIGRLASEGTDYATAGRQYFSSSAEYQALVEQIRRDLAEVQAALQGPSAASALSANSPAMQTMLAGNEQLRQIVSDQSAQIASLSTMVDRLTAQLQRVAVVGR